MHVDIRKRPFTCDWMAKLHGLWCFVYRDISLLYENFMCCKVIFAIKKQNLWYFSELLMLMFKFPQTSEAKIHGVFINLNKHKLFTRIMSLGKAHAQRTWLPFLSNGGTVFFETRHTLVDCVVLIFIWEICADVFHPLHGLVFLHNHWPVHHVFEPQGAVPVVWHTKKSPYNKYRKDFYIVVKVTT